MPDFYPMKKRHPGGTSLGYEWKTVDDVVMVAEEHVAILEQASHGDIYQGVADDPELAVYDAPEDDTEPVDHPEPNTPNSLAEALDVASVTTPQKTKTTRSPAKTG